MGLVVFASMMCGATITSAIYQFIITGNLAWLWLIFLNIAWLPLLIWGLIIAENE
ncbi:hypothetical protein LCGC14_3156630 [marine sediment metagenome]|uniref:Uncharacterized protein n=1 Tax=marine sediment metagenome TaxID=412755 RepID=A0A0F8VSF1_9ZZZZ